MQTEYNFTCPCCGSNIVIHEADLVAATQEVDTPEANQIAFELGYVLADSIGKEQ